MRVRILAAAFGFAALFSNASNAQSPFSAGISFGSSFSTVKSDLFSLQNNRLGFTAGAAFVVPMGSRFEFNPEVAYIQKGAAAESSNLRPELPPAESSYNYFYRSIEGSFLVGYQPLTSLPVRLQAGAFLDANSHRLTDNEEQFVGNVEDFTKAMKAEKLNDAFAGLDYGPVVGVGVGQGRFRASVRYYPGMKNLYNYLEFAPEGHSIRTSSLRFTATYFLF